MKTACIQARPLPGNVEYNLKLIEKKTLRAAELGADLAVTPEAAITGYPVDDLLLRKDFVKTAVEAVEKLAVLTKNGPALLVGGIANNKETIGKRLFNASFLLRNGKIESEFHKSLLPTYNVFDEARYFEPGPKPGVFELGGIKFGVAICEDVWNDPDFWRASRYRRDPVAELVDKGAEVILNPSAVPFSAGRQPEKEKMLSHVASKHGVMLLSVNQVGGNGHLLFEGRSAAFGNDGALLARGKAFEEDLFVVDLDARKGEIPEEDFSFENEAFRGLVFGTREYVRSSGFEKVVLGLSGGMDSAMVATIAARSLGPENVLGVLMPSPYSSEGSVKDAEDLAANLGIRTMTIPIENTMKSFEKSLAPAFENLPRGVTEENVQARIRGTLLMALSNKFGAMLLATGNKSEAAAGYCTLYGDTCGSLAVIGDVYKTDLYAIAKWLNEKEGREVVPKAVLEKKPSAELAPGQCDQDSLPPYEILDGILRLHIEKHKGAEEIVAEGYNDNTVKEVMRLVADSEFKRSQAAPCLRISDHAFGPGRRIAFTPKPY